MGDTQEKCYCLPNFDTKDIQYIAMNFKSFVNLTLSKKIFAIFGIFCWIFGVMPILFGYLHTGTVILSLYGTAVIFYIFYGERLSPHLNKLCKFLVEAATMAGMTMLSLMLIASYFTNYNGEEPATVIVLGCAVHGDTPSTMLRHRLNAGLEELNKNPESVCIVSGGRSEGDEYSEAEVMKMYLTQHGIAEERIFTEENSIDTETNIKFSAEIISENNLSENVIIATDDFHQFRAAYHAREQGLHPYGAGSFSAPSLAPGYYVREFAAIFEMIILE